MFGVRARTVGDDDEILRMTVEGAIAVTNDRDLLDRISQYNGVGIECVEKEKCLKRVWKILGREPVFPGLCVYCGAHLLQSAEGYWRCPKCGHLYWKGSHWPAIMALLRRLKNGR